MTNDLPSLLASIAGVLLSLAFAYIPGLSDWFGQQSSQTKSLLNLGCLALAALGAYAVTCWQIFNIPGLTCSEPSVRTLVAAFLTALAVNQGTYLATRRLKAPG